MTPDRPRFLVVDGLTGSGKSTIIRAVKKWSEACGHKVFDLEAWCLEHQTIPRFEDVAKFDTYFTFEPTKAWTGSAIREEMSRTDQPYSGLELAHAFSLDRLTLYRRLILPARAAGKTIIQDRSFTSSIIYQPVMPNGPTLEQLLALPGNTLALENSPDALIITNLPPEKAKERLEARALENKGVFQELELLRKIHERFQADWFRQLLEKHGTIIHDFDADQPKELMERNAQKFIESILTSC
jgi:thymidylate kinase